MNWKDALVFTLGAIAGAIIAAGGDAYVAHENGKQQRLLEREKAATQTMIEDKRIEAARVLEMIKNNNPDQNAQNLQFLLDAGLIVDQDLVSIIQKFLEDRKPGTGPATSAVGTPTIIQGPPPLTP